jgi:hypothetical protein
MAMTATTKNNGNNLTALAFGADALLTLAFGADVLLTKLRCSCRVMCIKVVESLALFSNGLTAELIEFQETFVRPRQYQQTSSIH